ncbi:hypothetical protein GCM10023340_19490 [Nocardioides marinquilinus]|uniref:Multidrug transporter n=1 Tax=Nocardioides marinquilinus TaxID=1210400 RepID=A0ABP9PJ20_9ACTN
MSEQESESTSEDNGSEELEGLQEQHLDSITGGGTPRVTMDLQDAEMDKVEKSEGPTSRETKERSESPADGDDD